MLPRPDTSHPHTDRDAADAHVDHRTHPKPTATSTNTAALHHPAPITATGSARLYGLGFSPYVAGQDPAQGAEISKDQLCARLALIAPFTRWVRTYGMAHGLAAAGRTAHELGLKVALQAWLGPDMPGNENDLQIANLIAAGHEQEADLLIVGSEVLFRGDLSADQLSGYIRKVKQAVPTLGIATADTLDACENTRWSSLRLMWCSRTSTHSGLGSR